MKQKSHERLFCRFTDHKLFHGFLLFSKLYLPNQAYLFSDFYAQKCFLTALSVPKVPTREQ